MTGTFATSPETRMSKSGVGHASGNSIFPVTIFIRANAPVPHPQSHTLAAPAACRPTWELRLDPETCQWNRTVISAPFA
eukprot:358894-Chlamydomonas_euryale.AAC.4